jgi:hypothetical protein
MSWVLCREHATRRSRGIGEPGPITLAFLSVGLLDAVIRERPWIMRMLAQLDHLGEGGRGTGDEVVRPCLLDSVHVIGFHGTYGVTVKVITSSLWYIVLRSHFSPVLSLFLVPPKRMLPSRNKHSIRALFVTTTSYIDN